MVLFNNINSVLGCKASNTILKGRNPSRLRPDDLNLVVLLNTKIK